MKFWKKALLALLVASFPLGLWAVRNSNRLSFAAVPAVPGIAADAVEAAVKMKATELADLDVKIVAAQGEVLKYAERRHAVVKQLESLRDDLTALIDSGAPKGPAAK